MTSRVARWLLTVVAILLCFATASAQSDRGIISGVITDSSGAVVPNAGIVLTNADTHVVTRSTGNQLGLYTLSNVPVGKYDLTVTATGFKAYQGSGLVVSVGQSLRIDVTLTPGQNREFWQREP